MTSRHIARGSVKWDAHRWQLPRVLAPGTPKLDCNGGCHLPTTPPVEYRQASDRGKCPIVVRIAACPCNSTSQGNRISIPRTQTQPVHQLMIGKAPVSQQHHIVTAHSQRAFAVPLVSPKATVALLCSNTRHSRGTARPADHRQMNHTVAIPQDRV